MSIVRLTFGAVFDAIDVPINGLTNGQNVRFTKSPSMSYLYEQIVVNTDDSCHTIITDKDGDKIHIYYENGVIIKVVLEEHDDGSMEYYYAI